jgi:O-antigen/teichoic acid export membrane protein
MPTNTARIAKNTLMLYFRQILIMLVSLYTVRVVLNTLGAEDYGIYNVVGGVVTMFGFLSGSMATASQRYFSFELGRGDFEQLKRIFSLSFTIYVMIATLVLILAETAGLWFVANKLAIPSERKNAAIWAYHFSIISFLFTILTAPYMAAIIAHEDMNIYAYVSIAEALLRLGTVFLLRLILLDKLQLYGILLCAVTIILIAVYRFICVKKYKECKYQFYWNTELFKEITSYTGWNLFGSSVNIFKFQMVNILLNQFFNPVVIAARGIAASVNSAVTSFSQNFSAAMRPQIIKSYAAGKKEEMLRIMYRGSKGTFFLMYIFVLPLVLEMPLLLSFWLKNPPEYVVLFTRLILLDALVDSVSYPIMAAAQATGKIKLYQSVVGGILLLNLPLSWLALSFGLPPYSVMVIAIFLTFFAFLIRLIIVKQLVGFFITQFVREVLLPIFFSAILSIILPTLLCLFIDYSFLRSLAVIGSCFFSICSCFYCIGLTSLEKKEIKIVIMEKLFNKNGVS